MSQQCYIYLLNVTNLIHIHSQLFSPVTAVHSLTLQKGDNSINRIRAPHFRQGFIISHPSYTLTADDISSYYSQQSTYSLTITDLHKSQRVTVQIKTIHLSSPSVFTLPPSYFKADCVWNASGSALYNGYLTITGGNGHLLCYELNRGADQRYELTPNTEGQVIFALITQSSDDGFLFRYQGLDFNWVKNVTFMGCMTKLNSCFVVEGQTNGKIPIKTLTTSSTTIRVPSAGKWQLVYVS